MMSESETDVVSWTVMITGFAKLKDLASAWWYFERTPEKSVVTWNAMLSGYAQNGLADMLRLGVRPNETTWVTVISACSSHGDLSLAHSLVKLIDEQRLCLNISVKTALLDMHAKCKYILSARRIFNELCVERNLVTWNAMVSGYTYNGQPALAIEFFKEMIDCGDSKPDEVTMIGALSACGHVGHLELGDWIIDYIAKNQIKLSVSGYRTLIFMYARCGNLKEAKRVLEEMNERDVVFIISVFASNGDGVETLNLFSKMKEEGIEPDHVTYTGVLPACSRSGLLEEGQKIFESIRNPSVDHYARMDYLLSWVGDQRVN